MAPITTMSPMSATIRASLFGRAYRLFDVAGTMGISGMLLILLISVIQNTIKLYRKESLQKQHWRLVIGDRVIHGKPGQVG